MLLSGNLLERIAYNGVDVFGHHNTLEHNVIRQPCYAKGDCGGVRTFGSDDIDHTSVHDLLFDENLIINTSGNTNGCHSTYQAEFGFGLYIDNCSRDVTLTGNTIISSTVSGILYQNSTGVMTDNTLYNNSRGTMYSSQVNLTDSPT
jgi:parallel beta-helix repeat protein